MLAQKIYPGSSVAHGVLTAIQPPLVFRSRLSARMSVCASLRLHPSAVSNLVVVPLLDACTPDTMRGTGGEVTTGGVTSDVSSPVGLKYAASCTTFPVRPPLRTSCWLLLPKIEAAAPPMRASGIGSMQLHRFWAGS